MSKFSDRVYQLIDKIPAGKVSTYGEVARKLGNKNMARAVGMALGANEHPIAIPCHRIVMSDGSLGGYSAPGGRAAKARLLREEKVEVSNGKVDLLKFAHKFD